MSRSPSHLLLIGADRVAWDGRVSREPVVVLPAATPHRTASRGRTRLVVYLDPRRYRLDDVASLAERWVGVDPDDVSLHDMFDDALRVPLPRLDRRLERAYEALESDVSIGEAAARLRMSANWLSRLMMEATGSSPRAWRSYLRLQRAIVELAAGRSATHAAHAAGFSDAAHLTRTCRGFIGTTPRVLSQQCVEVHTDAW